jgi:ATP-dependent Clp protease ATP-binding subunit ClpA
MGVTRQAAQKRFVPKTPGEGADLDPNQGFNRFTPRAKNVVMAAHNEAHAAHHAHTGTGHLVLGLLSEPTAIAAQAILAQGVTLETVRETVTAALPPAAEGDVPELIPYDGDAKKALELTFREALRLGHNYIGTEHLLLALLEHEGGTGPLSDLGIDKAATEASIEQQIGAMVADQGK